MGKKTGMFSYNANHRLGRKKRRGNRRSSGCLISIVSAVLLLAIALLLPTLALAAEAPTFDFTAEEWLERYQEVVPEDSEWWFDRMPTYNGTKRFDIVQKNFDPDTVIYLPSEIETRVVAYAMVSINPRHEMREYDTETFCMLVNKLCVLSRFIASATLEDFTDEETDRTMRELGIDDPENIVYGETSTTLMHESGVFFTFNQEGGNLNFIISLVPFDEIAY